MSRMDLPPRVILMIQMLVSNPASSISWVALILFCLSVGEGAVSEKCCYLVYSLQCLDISRSYATGFEVVFFALCPGVEQFVYKYLYY